MLPPAGKRKIKCARPGCGHEWYTRSKSKYVSCPLCNYNNKSKSSPPTKKVKCTRCDHEWKTRSKLGYITCPNCRYNNKVVGTSNKSHIPESVVSVKSGTKNLRAKQPRKVKPHKEKQPAAVPDATPQDTSPADSELEWMRGKEKREATEKKEGEIEWMKFREGGTQDG